MVADLEMIWGKLSELETYVHELESLREYTLEDLESSLPRFWSVIHGLQLSIQVLLDVGNHLLAERGIKAGDYTEIIDELGKSAIIPAEFAQGIRGMAGFRNVLVHGYASLEVATVYQTLQNNLDDFLRFAQYIKTYIREKPPAAGS